jgi:serine protease AprX
MANYRFRIIFLFLFAFSFNVFAQDGKYMVFFKDKQGTPYTVNNPSQYLSQKSIARRVKHNINATQRDLPVNPAYVNNVKNVGVDVFYKTKWMNGVLVQGVESKIQEVRDLPFVDRVEFVAPMPITASNGGIFQTFKNKLQNIADMVKSTENSNLDQLTFHGIEKMHEAGYNGTGITIAVFDDGFLSVNTSSHYSHLFNNNRVIGTWDFVNHQSNVYHTWGHGTRVLSTLAATPGPSITGSAYNANYVFCITEDGFSEYRIEEYNWLFAAEFADSIGVDIISTSLGYNTFQNASFNYTKEQMNGITSVIARASEIAFETGIFLVTSAGNDGGTSWNIITTPADAPNSLTVGAINRNKVIASFSSRGPSATGQIKPDVVGVGLGTTIVMVSGAINNNGAGTSFSAPIISGFAANLIQEFPSIKNSQLLEAIRKSGDRSENPNNDYGYGIPDYLRAKALLTVTSIRGPREKFLSLYPNPSTSSIFIKTDPVFEANSDIQLRIIDVTGKIWYSNSTQIAGSAFEGEIDISTLPKGPYFFQLVGNKKNVGLKFVKE